MRLGYDQQLFDDQLGLLQKVQGNGLALSNLEGPAGSSMNRRAKHIGLKFSCLWAKGQSLNCYNLKIKTYEFIHSDNVTTFSKKTPTLDLTD